MPGIPRFSALLTLALLLTAAIAFAQAPALQVQRFHVYSPTFASSGQPARDQIPAVAAAGYKVVINLAPQGAPGSLGDERQRVEGAGMQYFFFPVDWEKPSLDQAAQVLDLLDKYRDVPVLLHCSLNSRASAFAYLYRTLRAGEPEAAEYKVMSGLWALNRGIELENTPQWVFFLEDAKVRFGKK
jgi:protein tyrosine phosphatase (PTP) superfamily phosphohydrolase (DUF442 family)